MWHTVDGLESQERAFIRGEACPQVAFDYPDNWLRHLLPAAISGTCLGMSSSMSDTPPDVMEQRPCFKDGQISN
jgi:hypothetical protein